MIAQDQIEGKGEMLIDFEDKAREFNLREGMKKEDEMLPKRFSEEKHEDSGKVLTKAELDRMLSDYYEVKGWG